MNEGESETQIVQHDGNKFKMTATKNRFQIHVLDGKRKGEKLDLVYSPTHKSWSAIKPNGEVIRLATIEQGLYVLHLPNDKDLKIDPLSSRNEGLALIEQKLFESRNNSCWLAELD